LILVIVFRGNYLFKNKAQKLIQTPLCDINVISNSSKNAAFAKKSLGIKIMTTSCFYGLFWYKPCQKQGLNRRACYAKILFFNALDRFPLQPAS
jgi:hypothetical protein